MGRTNLLLLSLLLWLVLRRKCVFTDYKNRKESLELLQDADVLVAPSVPTSDGRREGIPVVLIEAMSSGVPIVASNISGIPELVLNEDTGLLVPPRDVAAWQMHWNAIIVILPCGGALAAQAGKKSKEFDLYKNAAKLAQQIRLEFVQ